jgi:hypothetical protein
VRILNLETRTDLLFLKWTPGAKKMFQAGNSFNHETGSIELPGTVIKNLH